MASMALQPLVKAGLGVLSGGTECEGDAAIVLVLGWFGAQNRHMAKYAEAVLAAAAASSRRVDVAYGVCPGWAVFSPTAYPRRRFGENILRAVEEVLRDSGPRPVYVYAFSNGGAFVWWAVSHLVHGPKETQYPRFKENFKGIAYDSAPCFMHISAGVRAITDGISNTALKYVAAVLFVLIGAPLSFRQPQAYWRFQTEDPTSRQLFIFSHADHLCDFRKLHGLVAARTARGVAVSVLELRASGHVQHLRSDRAAYVAALAAFFFGPNKG